MILRVPRQPLGFARLAWLVAVVGAMGAGLALPAWAQSNGNAAFSIGLLDNGFPADLDIYDAITRQPLPTNFMADAAGRFNVAGDLVLNDNAANPIGSITLAGQGGAVDPGGVDEWFVDVSIQLDAYPFPGSGSAFGIITLQVEQDLPSLAPQLAITTTQSVALFGAAGSPPAVVRADVSPGVGLQGGALVNVPGAGLVAMPLIPGINTQASELVAVPSGSVDDSYVRLRSAHSLSLLNLTPASDFSLLLSTHIGLTAAPEGLAADYNTDGRVDAADYTAWRDQLGEPAGALPNDTAGGPIGVAQYELWRSQFGETQGAASAAPEPATAFFAAMLGLLAGGARRSRG